MKPALLTATVLFSVGLISKFFHLPFNAIIMMVAILGMIVIVTLGAILKRFNLLEVMVGLAAILWIITLLSTLKFWGATNIFLVAASVLSAVAFVLGLRQKKFKELIPIGVSLTLCLIFYKMPTDTRYYLVSIKWNHEIGSDYFSWDKYSWFLCQNTKYDEALKASNKALTIAQRQEETEWVKLISEHNSKIKNRSWEHFR